MVAGPKMAKRKQSSLREAILEMADGMRRTKIMPESSYRKIVNRLSGDSAKVKKKPGRRA
jgi:hypothetical protein